MKLTIDQIPCDLDPSQRIALDYDAQDLADVRSGNKGHCLLYTSDAADEL